jgi:hypothetical protein
MVALADVLRRFAQNYLSAHGTSVLPSHRRAIADILACRTEQLGGHLWRCDCCRAEVFSYPFMQEPKLLTAPNIAT